MLLCSRPIGTGSALPLLARSRFSTSRASEYCIHHIHGRSKTSHLSPGLLLITSADRLLMTSDLTSLSSERKLAGQSVPLLLGLLMAKPSLPVSLTTWSVSGLYCKAFECACIFGRDIDAGVSRIIPITSRIHPNPIHLVFDGSSGMS